MLINIDNLSCGYNETPVFESFDLEVCKGEFVSIIGTGKSCLMRVLSGQQLPLSGRLYIKRKISQTGCGVAFLPQNYQLIPQKTVVENLLIPLSLRCIPKEKALPLAENALREFGLFDYRDFQPAWLSDNLCGLVAFAEILLFDSEIYLLDEPFERLTGKTKQFCYNILRNLHFRHKTVILATRDSYEASVLADRIVDLTDYNCSSKMMLTKS